MIPECIGALSLGVWIYLIFARGGFWRLKFDDLPAAATVTPGKRIAVIVPARNEAPTVANTINSLLRQEYPGVVQVYLVDDHSSDGTAERAGEAAVQAGRIDRLTIVVAEPLPDGWTGKLWALSEGITAATQFNPDYYWFTDADIVHEPEVLRDLLTHAEITSLDLASLMVKLRCESFAEKMLIPAFVFFFFKLYPPAWVASSRTRTAAAAGGCILIRANALERIGGIAKIRDQLIDDCALAREVKQSGGKLWLGTGKQSRSLRTYESFSEVGRMIARTAFTQLSHSALLLCGVVLAMVIIYVVPIALLGTGKAAALLGACAWILMMIAYAPTLRLYRLSPLWALLLPFTAIFYVGATLASALQYWTGRGGSWKGRLQDLART
ncbi:MAG: glycosyltransferase [Acidobacteriaceae bacterium]|nr:glycosyltransferase [Acidobacteriaceae bacterium]